MRKKNFMCAALLAVTLALTASSANAQFVRPTQYIPTTLFTRTLLQDELNWDFQGENGKLHLRNEDVRCQGNSVNAICRNYGSTTPAVVDAYGLSVADPSLTSLGYPYGVPSNFSFKYAVGGLTNIQSAIAGRGAQTAGAIYNQIYNASLDSVRPTIPNAQIQTTRAVVYYYSIAQNKWIQIVDQSLIGSAYAEDFLNNETTGAEVQTVSGGSGYLAVRAGINNASPNGSGQVGGTAIPTRTNNIGQPVGYNYHGFGNRFAINWADVRAIYAAQMMRCMPFNGIGVQNTDCLKGKYIANLGLDSWATTTSSYDNFVTHGGVTGSRFKPVITGNWELFTLFAGDTSLMSSAPMPSF
jgi:YD repeat-containing protein